MGGYCTGVGGYCTGVGGYCTGVGDPTFGHTLWQFRLLVLTVAPDAAARVELVLSKGYVVLFASLIFLIFVGVSTLTFSAFYVTREVRAATDGIEPDAPRGALPPRRVPA